MSPRKKKAIVGGCAALLGISVFARQWLWYGFYCARYSHQAQRTMEAPPILTNAQAELMAQVRKAGLAKDQTKLPLVRQALADSHPQVAMTAMLAAARIGDAGSIERIDIIARNHFGEPISDFADVALARIRTEQAVGAASSSDRLSKKITHFLNRIRLSEAKVNGAVRAYAQSRHTGAWRRGHAPFEVYALRAIAEFCAEAVRHGVPVKAGGNAPQNGSSFCFDLDHVAPMKIHLATLPSAQRIEWLIDCISQQKVEPPMQYYWIRALADDGPSAVGPVVERLKQFKSSRQGCTPVGVTGLFRALECISDDSATSVIWDFVGDHDRIIEAMAQQSLQRVSGGFRFTPWTVDY